MDPIIEKVFQRLAYEKLLLVSDITPKRVRVTLEDILCAGEEEPRILQALPAVILYKPTIIYRLNRDLPKYPELTALTQNLFNEKVRPREFKKIPTTDYAEAALTFKKYLDAKKIRQKSRTITLRLTPADYQELTDLSRKKGKGYSDLIRELIHHR